MPEILNDELTVTHIEPGKVEALFVQEEAEMDYSESCNVD